MTDLLEEVMQHGTGASAGARLKHPLGGKTGTTNDFTDAWFIGFSPSITCGVWIGRDEKKSLGDNEPGGLTALPVWESFMRTVISDHPQESFPGAKPHNVTMMKTQSATNRPQASTQVTR
jgi:penicillin-binding protein 1A